MTYSELLIIINNRSEEIRKECNSKNASANHFFLALFELLSDEKSLPDTASELCREELGSILIIMEEYRVSYHASVALLKSYLFDSSYDPRIDELSFNNLLYTLKAKLKRKGEEQLSALHIVSQIIKEPTECIKKCVFTQEHGKDMEKESSEVDTADEPTTISHEPTDLRAALEQNNGDINWLSKLVDDMKGFQNTLLNAVYGQNHAVRTFVSGCFQASLHAKDIKPFSKPRATFLFAGPPGVGKTFLAEKAADALGLPYQRFDMSEYSDKESNLEFCGVDEVYKHAKPGNVTKFVAENPRCVLLFDEIEKAHLNVIYLFLQILDAGRLRDNFTDKLVSFSEAIIIFTTNAGKALYEDPGIVNLSGISRKRILKALSSEINPLTNNILFPAAICSRFASGNVIMFNHLTAHNLTRIVQKELNSNILSLTQNTGLEVNISDKIASAIMLSVGGKADARTVQGRANAFFHEELYELLRLVAAPDNNKEIKNIKTINCRVALPTDDPEINGFFVNSSIPEILVFSSTEIADNCREKADERVIIHSTDDIERAKDILFDHDISLILCDVKCNIRHNVPNLLNIEDLSSEGRDFLSFALNTHNDIPLYLIEKNKGEISQEEFLSFAGVGAMGLVALNGDKERIFAQYVYDKCCIAYQQNVMRKIERSGKVLSYKSSQTVSSDGTTAVIELFGFTLSLAPDTEDSKSILSAISRPDIKFRDVIGAEEAKKELAYFVDYLKSPTQYLRRGVRVPKGILLYGPPGTGKTMLAKAMAGESDVTFITADGNSFLKKFVGEGAESVHKLFNTARKYAPAILFIDEIDAVAQDRSLSSGEGAGNVLTAFLTEMDGFNTDTTKPVFVLAATNSSIERGSKYRLDPAILRRFDRKIFVDLPNKGEREQYLRAKMADNPNITLSEEQIENIAMRSTGTSIADLESIIELAIRNSIRSKNYIVTDESFEEAFESYNDGEAKKWNTELLLRTARHEAGHALICYDSGEIPSYLTIVARGDHGGYMQHDDSEEKYLYTKNELLAKIRTALGGRAAEIVYYGESGGLSTSVSGDLATATSLAEQMICNYGMDEEFGLAVLDRSSLMNSSYYETVRKRLNEILSDEFNKAVGIIGKNRAAMDALVDALIQRNHLNGREIAHILTE